MNTLPPDHHSLPLNPTGATPFRLISFPNRWPPLPIYINPATPTPTSSSLLSRSGSPSLPLCLINHLLARRTCVRPPAVVYYSNRSATPAATTVAAPPERKIDSHARREEQAPMMNGRVHPAATNSDFSGETNQSAYYSSDPSSSPYSFHFEKPVQPPNQHLKPPPGTYIVQVPKDKVFRTPPPENARLLEHYTRRAKRRSGSPCLRACLYLFVALFSLAVLLAAFVGVICIVFQPRQPVYTFQSLAVSGLDGIGNASAPAAFSPGFAATIRADNPNSKIGVHYDGAGSHIAVAYDGVRLASGAWPAFYQEHGNVTVFVAKAKGAGIRFSESVRRKMTAAARLRSVPFDVDMEVPVRLQFGDVKTWALPVTVRCAVAVDRLAANAKVVSKSCNVKVPFLFWRD